MSASREVHLTVASRLLGKSLAQTSRLAAAGQLGPVRRADDGKVMVQAEGIENFLGAKVTDDQITRAQGPKVAFDDYQWAMLLDPGVQGALEDKRDAAWQSALKAAGLKVQPPPHSELTKLQPDNQRFFTRSQVEQLLVNALIQRDAAWKHWINGNLTTQAKNPDGPGLLMVRDIQLKF